MIIDNDFTIQQWDLFNTVTVLQGLRRHYFREHSQTLSSLCHTQTTHINQVSLLLIEVLLYIFMHQ